MSFQAAHIEKIRVKTGLTPADFFAAAKDKGLLEPGFTTKALTDWLRAKYGLEQGHAWALHQAFKENGWVPPRKLSEKQVAAKAAKAAVKTEG